MLPLAIPPSKVRSDLRPPGNTSRAPRSVLVLVLPLFAACGGGGQLRGDVYDDSEARFRIGLPGDGWERLDVEGQNDLAWSHSGLASVIQVNSSCDPALDIPLRALTAHLLIGFTEREIASEELVALDSREALRTQLVARLDGVPREMVLTVLKKDGCVYDFALVAPPGSRFARALSSYESVLSSFEAGGGR